MPNSGLGYRAHSQWNRHHGRRRIKRQVYSGTGKRYLLIFHPILNNSKYITVNVYCSLVEHVENRIKEKRK